MRAFGVALLLGFALTTQAQDLRLALVIGNSSYKVGPLRNPANDARAMAAALKSSGFDVMHGENLSHRQMFEMTRDFGKKLRPGVVALFYYAGHGLQVRDRNFLIPVEADVQSEEEVPYTSVDVNFLLDVMNSAKSRVNIVILDACRNNPFARSFRSGSRGLAQMEAPSGTLIAYATAPGRVASDGAGDHGLYTQHLLKHLTTPGLPVEILFKRVREGVERETKSAQVPWESSSLKGDFFFTAAAPMTVAAPSAGNDPAFMTELAFWDAIKGSQSLADYQAYLDTYPKGRFAALARARANALKATGEQVAGVAPTPVASGKLPAVGDRWVYRYTDLWRASERIEVTHTVTAVSGQEISEAISTTSGRRKVSEEAVWPSASTMGEWTLDSVVVREFSPYALALGIVRPGAAPQRVKPLVPEAPDTPEWAVRASVHEEEEVSVPAGTFRAVKVVLHGTRGTQYNLGQMHTFQMAIWYAPQSSRAVKITFDSRARVGNSYNAPLNRDVYELVSAPPR